MAEITFLSDSYLFIGNVLFLVKKYLNNIKIF